jgi:hypothetical protein
LNFQAHRNTNPTDEITCDSIYSIATLGDHMCDFDQKLM